MVRTKKTAAAGAPAIKGFDGNLACRGYKFAQGETYRHEGTVKACKSGFHAITADAHPLAVFNYYPPAGSRFCRVTISGVTDTDDGEKVAAEILQVGEEIGLAELTQEAVNWVLARSHPEGEAASGTQGAATASGTQGAATASGTQGAATASGYQGAATASGTQGAATASGPYGSANSPGKDGRVMGATGAVLSAVERGEWDGRGYPAVSAAIGIVGQNGLKADTWYACQGGKLVEAV